MSDLRGNWRMLGGVALSLGLVGCSDDASLGSDDNFFEEAPNSVSSSGGGSSSSSNTNGMGSPSTSDGATSTDGAGGGDADASASGDAVTGSVTSNSSDGTGGSSTTDGTGGSTTSGGVGGGGATDAGSTGSGGTDSTSTTGFDCETDALCVRPYECAVSCSAEPVYVGCCMCEEGLIDQFVECREVACGGVTCATDEFCVKPAGQCDAPDDMGTCSWRPEVCTADYAPVCGCDGETYSNDCMAAGAGVNVASEGECEDGV